MTGPLIDEKETFSKLHMSSSASILVEEQFWNWGKVISEFNINMKENNPFYIIETLEIKPVDVYSKKLLNYLLASLPLFKKFKRLVNSFK